MHIAVTTCAELHGQLKDIQKGYTMIQLWNETLFLLRKALKQSCMIEDTLASKRFLTQYKIQILNDMKVSS